MNKLLFVLFMAAAQWASAQTAPSPAPAAKAPAKAGAGAGAAKNSVQISFDDELVQGGVPKPEVDYISSRKQFNFKKMIKLRENFVPEVQKGKSEYGIAE